MKKILGAIVLILAAFAATAGQAQAFFGNDRLTQVFYTSGSNKIEIGIDLGELGTDFNLTDQNKTLISVDLETLAASKGATVSELSMGMYIDSLVNTSDAVWAHYFLTTNSTTPMVPSATKYTSMNTYAGNIANFYTNTTIPDTVTQWEDGSVVTADPTYANSYRTKMNQNNTSPGFYGGMNGTSGSSTPGELNLADMSDDFIDLYLWHFSYDGSPKTSHLVAGDSTDYVAVIRFYADGTTVLNPPVAAPTTTSTTAAPTTTTTTAAPTTTTTAAPTTTTTTAAPTTTTAAPTTTSTSTTSTTTTTTLPPNPGITTVTLPVTAGWTLLSSAIGFQPATAFGNSGIYTSVWKWVDNGQGVKTWALYLPTGDGGAAYAQSKGFMPLTSLASGDGFWVNSKSAQQVQITGTPVYGQLTMSTGWNLLGVKGAQPINVTALGSVTSVWKWSSANKNWEVNIPYELDGGVSYAASKGFSQFNTIAPGEGFWVNK